MSIASLFKPVDSSKTRLPRTDVLERVAKYATGKSVVSNYFDISTDELIKMLRNDLVPASEVEYVSDIVRTRLSGETTATPKKSVGETIKNTAKEFTVSDPTKDFITLEDIIGPSSAPSGFERGNYLESLIGSGTTGGPTQRGTPAKGAASVDSVDFERGKYLESLIGSGETGGAPQRGSPAKDKDYTDPLNARPDAPPARLGLEGSIPGRRPSGGMSYTPEAPEDSASIRQAALGSAEDRQNALDFLKKNQAVIDYYSKQRGEDPTGVGVNTDKKVGDDLRKKFDRETLGTGGFFANDPPAFVAGADPTRTTNVPALQDFQRGTGSDGDFGSGYSKIAGARPQEDQVARGLDSLQSLKDLRAASIMAENLGGSDAIKVDQVKSANKPGEGTAATSEIASMSKDPRSVENTGLLDTIKRYLGPTPTRQYEKEVNQDIIDKDKAARRDDQIQSQRLGLGMAPSAQGPVYPVKQGTSITELLYGRGEAKRMEEEAIATAAAEAADKATTDRMTAREAGISALSSDVGTATDQSGGIVPPAFRSGSADVSGTAPASIGGRYVPPASGTSSQDSAPSTSSQPSATAPAFRSGLDDKPTKDEKNDIKKAANEVAKNPSVGGIQSLFEQAGFSDALLQLGLGMMASKNPDFLGALGESGQSAVALMAKQREEAKKAKDDADKAALEERRVKAYESSVDNAATADKRPAAVQSAELVATSLQTALKQAAAGQFGTTEQVIAQQHAASVVLPFAERASLQAAKNWQSGFNDATTTKQKEAYKAANGASADEASNIAYQKAIDRHKLGKFLTLGEEPVVQTAPQTTGQAASPVLKYNSATGKVE